MTKRKKRNAITMVSLLLALAALIGVYVWYSSRPAATDDTKETENITLATIDTTKVTAVHYIGLDADISLTLKDSVWKSDTEPERPINQDKVNSILSSISKIDAKQTVIKSPENLTEYGLDKPSISIQVTLKDGSKDTLTLGDEVVTGDGYYALVNDDKTVYVVASDYKLNFKDLDFTEIEKAPTITAENINYISIDNREGKDIELKTDDSVAYDNSGAKLYNWRVLKPYGQGYSADNSKISAIQPNYASFNYLGCVDYKGDDLSKYGLNNPVASIDIGYFEQSATPTPTASDNTTSDSSELRTSKEYKIYIGNNDVDGNYYVRVDGSNMVYTLDASTVDKMLNVDVFDVVSHYVNIPNIDTVNQITADIAGKEYNMKISRNDSTNTDGKTETKASYSYNGSNVDETTFKNVYKTLIKPMYDAELNKEVDITALKPVMTINFDIAGDNVTTYTTAFLPYDDSFYIADKGTGNYFLVDKRTVDAAVTAISTFTAKE